MSLINMSPSAIPNNASLLKDTLNLIDAAQDTAQRYNFVPVVGSEGIPKILNMKMSPNAIPNNTSLAKDTLKSIDEAPVLVQEHLFVTWPESEGGRQKIVT